MKVTLQPRGLNRPFALELHDREDLLSTELRTHGVWEAFETTLVMRFLTPGDSFVDVGANIGYYTLLASILVGSKGRVYAFEPEMENYALLERNCAGHPISNITCFNVGLADKRRQMPLFLAAENLGDHRLFDDQARPSVLVDVAPGDDCLPGNPAQINFLKVDTQGAETMVIAGLIDTLAASRFDLNMIIEYWPWALLQSGSSARALVEHLRPLGLSPFVIDHLGHNLMSTDYDELIDIAESGNLQPDHKGFVNLFLTSDSDVKGIRFD